jgi:glutathione peroxidase-family protein
VDKKGRVVERFAPMTPPSAIEEQIEKLLGR